MSPVQTLTYAAPVPNLSIRRRSARSIAPSLFPTCPEPTSPREAAGEPAPAAPGPNGKRVERPTADCPPPLRSSTGSPCQLEDRLHSPAVPLVGIARLAASSPPAGTKRKSEERPDYFLLSVRSVLNRCDSKRVPFEWTINPYRGCEFGCKYCYARYTHEYMELDGGEFEKKIFVKRDVAPLLAQDMTRKYSYSSESSGGTRPEHIAIGTATDPYQPAEKEYGATRACLEELARREGLSISIITKSNLIVRDIDVLKRIAERSNLSINVTVTTLRTRLARLLEPRAPRPDLRLAAIKRLREEGLAVGASVAPVIPGITDGEGELEAVVAAAKEAGAQWFFANVLFLMPSSAKQFLPFVREKFPRLAKQYDEWYRREGYAPEEYRKKIAERVARIRKEFGFGSRPWEERPRNRTCAQMRLEWEAGEVAMERLTQKEGPKLTRRLGSSEL